MKNKLKLLTLLGCFIISTQNCMHPLWGFLSIVLNTYYNYNTEMTFREINEFINYFYLGIYFVLFVFPFLINKFNKTLILFASLAINSILFVSFIYIQNKITLFIIAFFLGFVESLIVLVMNLMVVIIYPKKKSSAIGFCLSGISIAILIYSGVMTYLINPENVKLGADGYFSEEISKNIPGFFIFFGVSTFIVGMIGLILIGNFDTNFREEIQDHISRNSSSMESSLQSTFNEILRNDREDLVEQKRIELEENFSIEDEETEEDISKLSEVEFIKKFIFTKLFFILFVISLIRNSFYIYSQNNFKIITLVNINDDHFVSYSASISFLLNFAARIYGGYLIDKFDVGTINQLTFISYIFIALIYIAVPFSKFFFIIAICLIRISSGVNEVLINGTLYAIYKRDTAIKIFKYYMLFFILSPFVCDIVEFFFLRALDYKFVFFFFIGLSLIGMVILHMFKLKGNDDN